MSTFLELVQEVAEESGTIPIASLPSTVSGADGRVLRCVNWTNKAYQAIQRSRTDWRWLKADFSGKTTAGIRQYISSDARFRHWIVDEDNIPFPSFTCYTDAEGQDQEQPIYYVPWHYFRATYQRGSQAAETGEKPLRISIDDADQLVVYPTPTTATTNILGRFYKKPQTLTLDTDVPEMPESYHPAIKWRALMFLTQFDQGEALSRQYPMFRQEYMNVYEDLLHSQTPMIDVGGPLEAY